MSATGWEYFEVEADVGVRGLGSSRGEAFAQVTLGVFALLVAPGEVQSRERREVRAQAESPESLLVAWIDECLYVHEIEGFVVRSVEMTVCSDSLAHGVLLGETLDPTRHRVGTRVKGATSHQVPVEAHGGIYEGRVIIRV